MSTPLRLSADGLFYWDGKQWVSALSPDGRYRWDGTRWVPITPQQLGPSPVPQYSPAFMPPASRPPRVPTPLTRTVQLVVVGFFALSVVLPVGAIGAALGDLEGYMRQVALQQAAKDPTLYPDPQSYADTLVGVVDVLLVVAVVLIIAIGAVAIIGAMRRWRWVYYAILAYLALDVIDLPSAFLRATGVIATPALGPVLRVEQWFSVAYALAGAGLGAWLLVVLLRVGPWATRRPPAPA